jgi:predicted nucleic acid-binding protein
LLLLDDLKARKLATLLNFKITGVLGVIQKAKQMAIIDKVKPLIDKLLLTDFRIAENIIEEILLTSTLGHPKNFPRNFCRTTGQ